MGLWICEDNEFTVGELIRQSIVEFETRLKEGGRSEEIKILSEINFDFIRLMDQQSVVLFGKRKEWELLRHVYNDNLNRFHRNWSTEM